MTRKNSKKNKTKQNNSPKTQGKIKLTKLQANFIISQDLDTTGGRLF